VSRHESVHLTPPRRTLCLRFDSGNGGTRPSNLQKASRGWPPLSDVRRVPRARSLLQLAAAFVALALAARYLTTLLKTDPMRRLITASAGVPYREIQPRLAGAFHWAPLRIRSRGAEDNAARSPLLAAAFTTLTELKGDDSPQAKHAAAVAQLLVGDAHRAAVVLERLAAGTADATVWSDLAANRYVVASSDDDPTQLAAALAGVDKALRLDPHLPAALFNRALILEKFGLRDQARDAWNEYLHSDPSSDWAGEGRQHVRQLQAIPPFRESLDRNYARLARDPEYAHTFARQYPEDARRWGETEILGRWATAERAGDRDGAARHLAVA